MPYESHGYIEQASCLYPWLRSACLLQLAFEDLARRRLWQCIAQLHRSWILVGRHTFLTVIDDLLLGGVLAGLECYDGLDFFAHGDVWHANHRCFGDRRVAVQHLFD